MLGIYELNEKILINFWIRRHKLEKMENNYSLFYNKNK
jgi:hypothetical protein